MPFDPNSAPEKSEIDATRLKRERAEDEVRAIQAAALANSIRGLVRANGSKFRVITDNGKVNVFKDREVLIISLDKTGQYSLQHQKNAPSTSVLSRSPPLRSQSARS